MATVKLVAKRKASLKNGLTPIYIQYSYNRDKRTLINTGYKIEPKFWNYNKDRVKDDYPDSKEINDYLNEQLLKANKIIIEASKKSIDPTIKFFLIEFSKKENQTNYQLKNDLFTQIDEFIDRNKRKVVPSVILSYRQMKLYLKEYEDYSRVKLSLNSFNYDFYQNFVEYLTYNFKKRNGDTGLATNTIGKTIRSLKVFLHDAVKRELIQKIDFSGFKAVEEEVESIYLSEDEILRIWNLDLSQDASLEKYRDIFVFSCFTAFRFSDFSTIKPSNIRGDYIHKTQKKVNSRVVVPMNDIVKQIMKKYNNSIPVIDKQKYNLQIKRIGKMAGIDQEIIITRKKGINKQEETLKKYQLITSHTGRRSFCTNEYLKDTPTIFIMKISGHRTEQAFLKYIRINEVEAAERMMEFWEKRKQLMKI